MFARYSYAHISSRRGSRFLAAVTDRDITAEYNRLSARRNDRIDESERDATLAEVIDWLERKVDDGALRRYVPIETARVTGIRAIGYGRETRYSASDVRDLLGEIEHGECADCGAPGPIVDTPDGHVIRDGGLDIGRVTLDDGDVYLCGSRHNGDAVCDACEDARDARTDHDVETCFDSLCACKFREVQS